MGNRESISRRLRFQILQRDGFKCLYCGAIGGVDGTRLEVDHVEPVAGGGTNDPRNLVTACRDCNGGKSDTPLQRPERHRDDTIEAMRAWWRVYGEIPDRARDVFARYLVESTLGRLLADIADVAQSRNTPEIDLRRIEARGPSPLATEGSDGTWAEAIDLFDAIGIEIG
jgi:hypothetical protein